MKYLLVVLTAIIISCSTNYTFEDIKNGNNNFYLLGDSPMFEYIDGSYDFGEGIISRQLEYPYCDTVKVDKILIIKKGLKKERYYICSYNLKKYYVLYGYLLYEYEYNDRISKFTHKENVQYSNPSSGSEHNYQTGPRGGEYYINSKGKKVYKKK